MPEAYRTFGAECSTPLMASDGFQLAFPFEPFRKMLSPDETRLDVTRKFDASVFWEELVASVADAWKSQDVGSLLYSTILKYLTVNVLDVAQSLSTTSRYHRLSSLSIQQRQFR